MPSFQQITDAAGSRTVFRADDGTDLVALYRIDYAVALVPGGAAILEDYHGSLAPTDPRRALAGRFRDGLARPGDVEPVPEPDRE